MKLPEPSVSRDSAMRLWKEERSEYAKEQVALSNIGLVGKVMKSLSLNTQDEDLFSSGIVGLVRAINTFDPDRRIEFSTYAIPVIRNEILGAFRKKRIVPSPSLDEPKILGDGECVLCGDVVPDKRKFENEVILRADTESAIKEISRRDAEILFLYVVDEKTQREIADCMGVTQACICRILKKIRKKLYEKI